MRLNSIKSDDVVNGEGVMVSVWVQGCPHRCKGCHNPETWDSKKGERFTDEHMDQILELLDEDGICRNLSILGGEPMTLSNAKGVYRLCKYIKEKRPNTKIYIWTGYPYEAISEWHITKPILEYVDYIIDGKFEEKKKDLSLYLRGSSNQRIIDVKKTLEKKCIELHLKC